MEFEHERSLLAQILKLSKDMSARLKTIQQTCDFIVSKASQKSTILKLKSDLEIESEPQLEHDEYVDSWHQATNQAQWAF